MPVRIPGALVVLALGLTLGVVGLAVWSGPDRPSATAAAQPPRPAGPVATPTSAGGAGAVAVLHDWDALRAAAWAAGDARALAALYTARSSAGTTDVALLRRYLARGLVVRGMRMQLLGVRVLVARPRRLEVEVTDRLASAVAVRAGDAAVARRLPDDAATTHRLTLRRIADRWLVDAVSAVGGR